MIVKYDRAVDALYIRFREPQGIETGEPVHPLIHVFRDEGEEITAIEIIDNRYKDVFERTYKRSRCSRERIAANPAA